MKKSEKQEFENLKNFAQEIKRLVRELGKSNYLHSETIKDLMKEYRI